MEIKLANSAGFCFGVKRAVDVVNEQIEKKNSGNNNIGPIYTYGPIIHNEEVVKDFENKGVIVMAEADSTDSEDADGIKNAGSYEKGTVIIRSHGVTKAVIDKLKAEGHEIVDATCPFVKKIHKIVEEHSLAGDYIVIIGNADHPEVVGITGWINGNDYTIINNEEEARNFSVNNDKNICIVSQTTFNHNKFQEFVEIIKEKGYYVNVLNTICDATNRRQVEAKEIASLVDAMIVIGGKNSSNTQKLFEICKKECKNTYYIQTAADLVLDELRSIKRVGITAGASTPNNIIEEVQNNVRNEL